MCAMNEVLNILAKIIDTVRFKLIEIQGMKNLEHRSLSKITKFNMWKCKPSTMMHVYSKEVNKEHPSYRNLSATATRVPQCTLGYSDFDVF